MRDLIARLSLSVGPASPCPYLPNRSARNIAFQAAHLPSGLYHSLMDLNFRRSGCVFYQPACDPCRQCQAIRVATEPFKPSRSQKRCLQRNADLTIEVCEPAPTEEKHCLFTRYLDERHDSQMTGDWQSFCDFLYRSPIETREVVYRHQGRLVGVGLFDVEPQAISTVYCYFDPDLAGWSIGTFNILWTIRHAREHDLPYVYLGYYIRDARTMNYKIHFRPCEILGEDGDWHRFDRSSSPA